MSPDRYSFLRFVFDSVPPGKAVVSVSDSSLQSFSFRQKQQTAVVKGDAVKLKPFIILGFDLEGGVTDEYDKPVSGIKVKEDENSIYLRSWESGILGANVEMVVLVSPKQNFIDSG